MREVIRTCVEVQYKYYNIPVQDRIYIAFGRLVTEKRDADEEYIQFAIEQIKSEFEFLEGVWNGEKGKS
jgi:hypothetical protein